MNVSRSRRTGAAALVAATLICLGPECVLFWTGFSQTLTGAHGPGYFRLMLNSLVYAGGTTIMALLLAVPLSLALFKIRVPCRLGFSGVFLGLAFIPLQVYVAAWLGPLGLEQSGLKMAIQTAASDTLSHRMACAVFVAGVAKAPIAVVLMGLALWGIPSETEEAVWLEAHRFSVLYHIVIRHLARGAVFAGSIVFGISLGEISVTDMLMIRTLAEEAYSQFQLTLDPGVAMVAGTSQFLPLLLPWAVFLISRGRRFISIEDPIYSHRSHVFTSVRASVKWVASVSVAALLLVLYGGPLASLVGNLEGLVDTLNRTAKAMPELLFSFRVSGVSSILALAAAFPIAYVTRKNAWRDWILSVALLSFFIPGSVLGISLVHIFNQPGIPGAVYDTSLILIAGQALRYFPLALFLLVIFLRVVPGIYDEMVALEGLSLFQSIYKVYVPVCRWPLLLAWIVTFSWCFYDLDTSIILCPPGPTTLPIRLFTMMHYGVYADVASTCVLLMVLTILLVVIGGIVWHFGFGPRRVRDRIRDDLRA